MLNRIVLMGRLTRDPELRKTQSDTILNGNGRLEVIDAVLVLIGRDGTAVDSAVQKHIFEAAVLVVRAGYCGKGRYREQGEY